MKFIRSLTRAEFAVVFSGAVLFTVTASPIIWETGKELWDIGTALLSVGLSILMVLIYTGVLAITGAVTAIFVLMLGVLLGSPRAKAIRDRFVTVPEPSAREAETTTHDPS